MEMGPRTHADEFADLEDHFDPEDDEQAFDDSDSDISGENNAGFDGREHYQAVSKSKLRKRELATLGPQYQGSRVSRKNLSAEDGEHDPFEEHSNDGNSSEDEIEEDESTDGQSPSPMEELEADEEVEADEDDSDAGTDDTSLSDEETDLPGGDRAHLRSLMNDSGKSVAASIAAAATADSAKGRAVKMQRQTFDSLLNARIRLQHALIASNSMAAVTDSEPSEDAKAYEGAEAAALNLFNSLSMLRDALPSQKAGEKRKRHSASTSSSTLWTHLQDQDAASKVHQRAVLQKWSQKTASATTTAAQSANRLNPTAQTTLLDVLDSHLAPTSMPRHVERTKVPRSCAPIQQKRPRPTRRSEKANGDTEEDAETEQADGSENIYDDADFYGILLKELLEARNANAAVDYSIAASNAANGGVEDEYKAARQAKSHSRPGADRKASKGRKMRYTVHEKLQNFMAPEDRGAWEQRQREELFGSLFGRQLQLREDEGDAAADRNGEEEALMLFRG